MASDLRPDPLASLTTPPQPWLIVPAARPQFILGFTLLTFLGGLVAARITLKLLPELGTSGSGGLAQVENWVGLILTGAAIGLAQGFMLRRYVSSWQWIVATSVGWLVSGAVALSLLESLGEFVSILAFVWLGFAQWLVLRQVAKPAWFWILLPSVASLGSFVLSPLFNALAGTVGELGTFLLLAINQFAVLGAVEGIGLCTLRQKGTSSRRRGSNADSLLPGVPEITDLEQLRSLAQQLQIQLTQAGLPEIAGEQDLIYLVDVTAEGAIADYQPVNQAAFDCAAQTPLPQLLETADSAQIRASSASVALARLQVIFQAPGSLAIRSTVGEPLA
ncbi:MAG TPA: hypothetical protein V6D04_01520 [Candidatus Obscuribacterales bacterium]